MAPILLRQLNSTESSGRALNGAHDAARLSIGIRTDNNDPSNLAPLPLIATLVVFGLFSLTIFSIFGRRLLEAGHRRRRNNDQGIETSGAVEDHYHLPNFLGLNHGQMSQRLSQPSVPEDIPKMWDIQCQGGPPEMESYKEHRLSWDAIMVSSCHCS